MMEAMWRLVWALPLVLLIGAAIVLFLKRFVVAGEGAPAAAERRMHLRESLALSDDTRMHLIELDRRAYFVVESKQRVRVEIAARDVAVATRMPARSAPAWLQQLRMRSR
jgi:hypothetical protein